MPRADDDIFLSATHVFASMKVTERMSQGAALLRRQAVGLNGIDVMTFSELRMPTSTRSFHDFLVEERATARELEMLRSAFTMITAMRETELVGLALGAAAAGQNTTDRFLASPAATIQWSTEHELALVAFIPPDSLRPLPSLFGTKADLARPPHEMLSLARQLVCSDGLEYIRKNILLLVRNIRLSTCIHETSSTRAKITWFLSSSIVCGFVLFFGLALKTWLDGRLGLILSSAVPLLLRLVQVGLLIAVITTSCVQLGLHVRGTYNRNEDRFSQLYALHDNYHRWYDHIEGIVAAESAHALLDGDLVSLVNFRSLYEVPCSVDTNLLEGVDSESFAQQFNSACDSVHHILSVAAVLSHRANTPNQTRVNATFLEDVQWDLASESDFEAAEADFGTVGPPLLQRPGPRPSTQYVVNANSCFSHRRFTASSGASEESAAFARASPRRFHPEFAQRNE